MGRHFIFIICCISSFTGCAAEKAEPSKPDTTPSPRTTNIKVVVPKDAIKVLPVSQNINVVVPDESIEVNIPKQTIELTYPDKLVDVIVPTPKVVVNIPTNAIKVTLPEQQNIVIPEGAVVVNLVRSPLIWLTVIFSVLTLCLSIITLIDKIKKDKKDDKKSLMDDFWYRTVIHPECTTIINGLYEVLAEQLKFKPFSRTNHDKSFEIIHDSLAKLDQLSVLPNGSQTYLKISQLMQTVEEQITAYLLYSEGSQTAQELIDNGIPVPENLIEENSIKYCVSIKKNIFALLLEFHSQLSQKIEVNNTDRSAPNA